MNNGLLQQEQIHMIELSRRLKSAPLESLTQLKLKGPINLHKRKRGSKDLEQIPLAPHLERNLCNALSVLYRSDEYQLEYFAQCTLPSGVSVGSAASQYDSAINRSNHYICFYNTTG